MADHPFGLGAIASPPDERDFDLGPQLDTVAPLPASFQVAHAAPIYNQKTTPECVAYSGAREQQAFDLPHTFLWDFNLFFKQIGGTADGAIIRNAFDRRLHFGYPLLPAGSNNSAAAHKIGAYYAVPKNEAAVKAALVQFGTLVLGTPWYESWFTPAADGTLPLPDSVAGGHAIDVDGYDAVGIWLTNSWGPTWALKGRCRMPWSYVFRSGTELWKAVDAK